MRRSEHAPLRRFSRSESNGRISLILTGSNFLDTLIVGRSTGVPLYATITQSRRTALYAIDAGMTLQQVAIVDWSQSELSRKNTTISIGASTRAIEDTLPTKGLLDEFMSANAPVRKYTCDTFACKWVENDDYSTAFLGASRVTCYRFCPPSSPSGPSRNPPTSSDQARTSQERTDTLLVAIEFCAVPHKPKVQICVYARELLRRVPGRDGLADLDHVVLGALLLYGGPLLQHKRATPEGWMGEEDLQNLLWSRYTRPAPNEIPPLYAVATAATSGNDPPPPYASRMSIVGRPRHQ